MKPDRKSRRRPALLLVLLAAAVGGCPGWHGFVPTPLDPASRVYPSVASGCVCPTAPPATGRFERVLIVVLENQDYATAIAEPVLQALAAQGASFTNFHGLFHPSYSNYLAMVAGKEIPTHFDTQQDLNECCLADLLTAKNLDWKNYAEGYPEEPGRCFTGHVRGLYARKHVPLLSFRSVQERQCDHIVAASQFDRDLEEGRLPRYAFYTPDLANDGHDTGLEFAARWLQGFLARLRRHPTALKGTLLIVTFDESADQSVASENHIYTVFLGDMVKPGPVTHGYNHYNVLRTIEENFGLCPLGGGDGGARPITEVWK